MKTLSIIKIGLRMLGNGIQRGINAVKWSTDSWLKMGGFAAILCLVWASWMYVFKYRTVEEPLLFVINTDADNLVSAIHCAGDDVGQLEKFTVVGSLLHGVKSNTDRRIVPGSACLVSSAGVRKEGLFTKWTRNIVAENCSSAEAKELCLPHRDTLN